MTLKEFNDIRARVEAAMPGPWRVDGETCDEDGNPVPTPFGLEGPRGMLWSSGAGEYAHPDWPTATFIAKAREDVPALLAEVERLNELCAVQNATMIDALCAKTDAEHKASTAFARGAMEMRESAAQLIERNVDGLMRFGLSGDIRDIFIPEEGIMTRSSTGPEWVRFEAPDSVIEDLQDTVKELVANAFARGAEAMRAAAADACDVNCIEDSGFAYAHIVRETPIPEVTL